MEIAAIASSASFQKSLRRFSPGQPSGLISRMIMMPTMTSARSFDMPPLNSNAAGCQSASFIPRERMDAAIPNRVRGTHP